MSNEERIVLDTIKETLSKWRSKDDSISADSAASLAALLSEQSIQCAVSFQNSDSLVLNISRGDFKASLQCYNDKSLREKAQEFRGLLEFYGLSHDLVAKPYFCDEETRSLCTDDVSDVSSLADSIVAGDLNVGVFESIARQLAAVHSAPSNTAMTDAEFTQMKSPLHYSTLERLSEEIFVKPYIEEDVSNFVSEKCRPLLPKIFNNTNVRQKVDRLRDVYQCQEGSLIHGNLSADSVGLKDGKIKLIRLEHARTGAPVVDLAAFLAQTLTGYHQHMLTPTNNDWHRRVAYKILDVSKAFMTTYLESAVGLLDGDVSQMISFLAGLIGCFLIARTIGPRDNHIPGIMDNPSAEHATLDTGLRLLNGYERINTMPMLLTVAFMLS